jgi:predicted CXXCH cytochrome family protein
MAWYFIILLVSLLLPAERVILLHYRPVNAECITCHGALIKNSVVHPDLESSCDICHTSNGKEHPLKNIRGFDLSEKVPVLCYNCHSDFQEKSESSKVVHGPLKDKSSCINCHNPHSSPNSRLLKDATNDLCLKCHDRTITNDSVKIRNIRQSITNAKSVHQALEAGCITCHNPHYSEKKALLVANFPAGQQYIKATADNIELCFMCHDKDLLEAKTTVAATNFRNGKTNLHYLHVKGDKGRNCTMCHDVHGAQNEKLITDKLKFGNWEMKIKFEPSAIGGSCLTACHSEKKYDRTIPKEVTPAAKQKAGTQQKSATQQKAAVQQKGKK